MSPECVNGSIGDRVGDRICDRVFDRLALKDKWLIYRACTMAFARTLGRQSPDEVIGKSDFDLFGAELAREQFVFDSQVLSSGEPDIATLRLEMPGDGQGSVLAAIIRRPVISVDQEVRGIDIQLLGAPREGDTSNAQAIDPAELALLVKEGLQGSLIVDDQQVLYANDRAACILGYAGAMSLINAASVDDIFDQEELGEAFNALRYRELTASPQSRMSEPMFSAGSCNANAVAPKGEHSHGGCFDKIRLDWDDTLDLSLQNAVDAVRAQARLQAQARARAPAHEPAGIFSPCQMTDDKPGQGRLQHALNTACPVEPSAPQTPPQISTAEPDRYRTVLSARSAAGSQLCLIARIVPICWHKRPAMLVSIVDIKDEDLASLRVSISHRAPSTVSAAKIPPVSQLKRQLKSLQRLRANEQRYRHYASAAADFFWEVDAHLCFRVISDGLVRVLDIPRERLLGRSLLELLQHPCCLCDESSRTNLSALLEHCQPFRDVEIRWGNVASFRVLRLSGIPVFDYSRRFGGYRGVGSDITAALRQADS